MIFNIDDIKLAPLCSRNNDLDLSVIMDLKSSNDIHENLINTGEKIVNARENGASVILMMGAHVIRSGVQRYIIDLMKRGFISCIATNGAGMIHDFEFALIGETTESVARYIKNGRFGFWNETGHINDIVNRMYHDDFGMGMGHSVGQEILNGDYPNKDISLLAQAVKYNVPVTVHVSIGQDIIHQFPNFDGASTGALSYKDFIIFAGFVQNLENGVLMNFGSAVMAPEVFLKALSMSRNIAHQQCESITRFSTLVCDLHDLPDDYTKEAPKDSAAYYFRPWKTMLVRTVADGGESFYVRGRHAKTVQALWTAINMEKTT